MRAEINVLIQFQTKRRQTNLNLPTFCMEAHRLLGTITISLLSENRPNNDPHSRMIRTSREHIRRVISSTRRGEKLKIHGEIL